MEPKSPLPRFEQQLPPVSPEVSREVPLPTPEFGQAVERGHERVEQHADTALGAAQPTMVLPVPVPPVATPQPTPAPVADHTLPAAAADEDLIEKEWVDKAKQIIDQTKDDPYRREQEVSKLQAEYLRKRYGRELGGVKQ